jgi:hypothetical protein
VFPVRYGHHLHIKGTNIPVTGRGGPQVFPVRYEHHLHIVTCLAEGRRYYSTLLSLLGNRNISMDTFTTPVFLRCTVTNSRKASVSIIAARVKEGKTIHSFSLRQLVFGVSSHR